MSIHPDQLGFDALLAETDAQNRKRDFDARTAHLPDTMAEAIQFHLKQIEAHHAAMLACDFTAAMSIREEAIHLASKLNGGTRTGIIATDEAPGCVLARECAAKAGAIPLWGQDGAFVLHAASMEIRVSFEGMFGFCASVVDYAGFDVRAAAPDKPFLSETGYRSFLGVSVPAQEGMMTDSFVRRVVESYVDTELRGKLLSVQKGSG